MPTFYRYRIKIVGLQLSPGESQAKDVMTTEVVATPTDVLAIAARFQNLYPRPGHRVLVHLLERSREPLPVDWESLSEPGNDAP